MSAKDPADGKDILLFVYDSLMSGEADHARLAGARALGAAATEATFDLVDLGPEMAIVAGGSTKVLGEVYGVGRAALASIDVHRGHPLKYKRRRIRLDDGREVEAYTLDTDQVRGRRKIKSGDYRGHMSPAAPPRRDGAWSKWAKRR